MILNEILKFSAESMEFVDRVENALFRNVKIKAFASGKNAHTLPISESILKNAAKTVYNKPILWKYNRFTDDANTHDTDEVPCGFVPETPDNKVEFETGADGRVFIVINALLWTKYSGRLVEIFERDGYKKDVSVEIVVNKSDDSDDKTPNVVDFVIAGITILGEWFEPASEGCHAELLKFSMDDFSNDKDEYIQSMNFEKNTIKIDNSKNNLINGTWTNPRRKLFNPLINASNKTELLNEAYLVTGDNSNPIITDYKYPHHVIKDGNLVLHKEGLMSAFNKASQQDIVGGKIKSHLLKHYKELGLTQENFSEFGISKEQFLVFSEEINKDESVGENDLAKKKEEEVIDNAVEKPELDGKVEDESKETEELIKNATDDKTTEENKPEPEKVEDGEVIKNAVEEDGKDPEKDKDPESNDKDTSMSNEPAPTEDKTLEFSAQITELSGKVAEMSAQISSLEKEKEEHMAKFETMSDYEELKKFKEDTMAKMAKDEEMAKMEKAISEIEERGVSMSKDDKDVFMSKYSDFNSIDAWKNYVKATVFDKAENINGTIRVAYPNASTVNSDSIWARI